MTLLVAAAESDYVCLAHFEEGLLGCWMIVCLANCFLRKMDCSEFDLGDCDCFDEPFGTRLGIRKASLYIVKETVY